MVQQIPLQSLPNVSLQTQLSGQACTLSIYQLAYGLFMDVYVGNELIVGGVICQNLNRVVRDAYLGFSGDFMFVDTQGADDPVYTGLGSRWLLEYLSESDLATLGVDA